LTNCIKGTSPILEITPKRAKKNKKSKAALETTVEVSMTDANPSTPSEAPTTKAKQDGTTKPQKDFNAIYLRKITSELADDLDKVREAQDFKANSVPMLIHALKQGERLFSVEEKRRVVGAAGQ
jgi:ribosome assembly protein 3